MSSVKLKHASGNGAILHAPAANPSNDVTLKVPSTTGSAGQFLRTASSNHSATNAELEWATVDTSIADDSIVEAKLDIHAAPSGTDKFLAYTSNGMEWAVPGGGAFSKVYKSNSSTSTAMNSGNDPVRVGGTGCEVVLTPPATTTSYLLLFHTGMHIGDDDGQWGIQFRVSDDNWSSNSTINFMHSQYGCEDNEKWRGQRTYMKEWKPGSTSEWKIGVWAQVWSSDGIDVTFNSHSGQSQLTVFELVDSAKSGDWG